MVIKGEQSAIEIELADPEISYGDGIPVDVSVTSKGFSGQASAWICPGAFDSFLADLARLEQRRQGSAEVEAMSGAEFWLRVYSTDRTGHLAVSGRVGSQSGYEHALTFGFDIDPSTLPWIVASFRKFKLLA